MTTSALGRKQVFCARRRIRKRQCRFLDILVSRRQPADVLT
jgi:hypothetical protein